MLFFKFLCLYIYSFVLSLLYSLFCPCILSVFVAFVASEATALRRYTNMIIIIIIIIIPLSLNGNGTFIAFFICSIVRGRYSNSTLVVSQLVRFALHY